MRINFGAGYFPDLPDFENPGETSLTNYRPMGKSYQPIQTASVITNALTARCQGFAVAQDSSGDWHSYAGDATKLYICTAATWASAGTGYTVGASELWQFVIWQDSNLTVNKIVALSKGEEPRTDTVGTGTFGTFMTSTKKPKAKVGGVVKSHLVLGDYNDGTNYPNGVIWSATGDYRDFDPSTSTGSGAQILATSDHVQRVIGGDVGLIFTDKSIWRMTYEGPPTLFRFDRITPNIGALSPGAVVQDGSVVYFISQNGFYRINADGSGLTPIGQERVDLTFVPTYTNLHRINSVVGPDGMIYFSYPTSSGNPTNIAIYNPFLDRWGYATFEHEFLVLDYSKSVTVDGSYSAIGTEDAGVTDLSVDDPQFQGGYPFMGHFDTAHRTNWWAGHYRTAVIDTAEYQFFPGARAFLNKAIPIVEKKTVGFLSSTMTVTLKVGYREQLDDDVTWSSGATPNAFGEVPLRVSARYMRFRLNIALTSLSTGTPIGIEIEPQRAGDR